jgi:hypothetical protein
MAFVVAALVLGGFTLYNLSNKSTSFTTDPQKRLANDPGNAHVNIKLNELLTFWNPIKQPPRKWQATETYDKRTRAREMAGSNKSPLEQKYGSAVVSVNNYRRGSGKMTPIAGSSQISSTTYWT